MERTKITELSEDELIELFFGKEGEVRLLNTEYDGKKYATLVCLDIDSVDEEQVIFKVEVIEDNGKKYIGKACFLKQETSAPFDTVWIQDGEHEGVWVLTDIFEEMV